MKDRTIRKIRSSIVIQANNFQTNRGTYRVCVLRHKSGDLLSMKTKDGELCELVNLSRRAAQHE